ncbi:hypothetical protein EDB86DRAFT_2833071 [Lactarius hatsudake]|nr:hypothetical protein EDB86DRAFT_2833071 [Lactarius hatsudake]
MVTMPKVVPETPAPNVVVSNETFRFDYPGSDIILRSCDSHNFRVPKLYIVNSSPVLREFLGFQIVLPEFPVVKKKTTSNLPRTIGKWDDPSPPHFRFLRRSHPSS